MEYPSILSKEFDEMAARAGRMAREESLRLGLPIFYLDSKTGMNIMEKSGRKFEIRFIAGAPRDRNYEILRELRTQAA